MSDDLNRLDSLLNKNVPDKPGKPAPYTPAAPPPVEDDSPPPENTTLPVEADAPPMVGHAPPEPNEGPFAPPSAAPSPTWSAPIPSSADEAASRVADFEQVADEMQRYADGLKATLNSNTERTWEITSDDGAFTITVDGRPRVRQVRIDPRAMRDRPEQLAVKVMALVNDAIRTSRQERAEAILSEIDPELRSAIRSAVSEAERMVPKEDEQ